MTDYRDYETIDSETFYGGWIRNALRKGGDAVTIRNYLLQTAQGKPSYSDEFVEETTDRRLKWAEQDVEISEIFKIPGGEAIVRFIGDDGGEAWVPDIYSNPPALLGHFIFANGDNILTAYVEDRATFEKLTYQQRKYGHDFPVDIGRKKLDAFTQALAGTSIPDNLDL